MTMTQTICETEPAGTVLVTVPDAISWAQIPVEIGA